MMKIRGKSEIESIKFIEKINKTNTIKPWIASYIVTCSVIVPQNEQHV